MFEEWKAGCESESVLKYLRKSFGNQVMMLSIIFILLWTPFVRSQTDCILSEWSDWTTCSSDGLQFRTRGVKRYADDCPEVLEYRLCIQNLDCVVGPWKYVGGCIDGLQNQSRTIVVQPNGNGTTCPETLQTVPCKCICKKEVVTRRDSYFTDLNVTLHAKSVLDNDDGVERAELHSIPNRGYLNFKEDGKFVYVPHINSCGKETFKYRAWKGNCSKIEKVRIKVKCNT